MAAEAGRAVLAGVSPVLRSFIDSSGIRLRLLFRHRRGRCDWSAAVRGFRHLLSHFPAHPFGGPTDDHPLVDELFDPEQHGDVVLVETSEQFRPVPFKMGRHHADEHPIIELSMGDPDGLTDFLGPVGMVRLRAAVGFLLVFVLHMVAARCNRIFRTSYSYVPL